MNETEWLASSDLASMLESLRGKVSDRKGRLFAVACCRRVWWLFPKWSRRAVEAAEQYADGVIDLQELRKARNRVNKERQQTQQYDQAHRAVDCVTFTQVSGFWIASATAIWAARLAGTDRLADLDAVESVAKRRTEMLWKLEECWAAAMPEQRGQAALLREVIGNPFRPINLDPSWLSWNDSCVGKIAMVIYDERRFEDLPILADALEEAGCTNADILAHCRQPGEHVRGCWVIDLLLGKE